MVPRIQRRPDLSARPSVGRREGARRAAGPRVCGWFPCGDWEEWAAPWEMRRAMRRIRQYLPDRRLVENTLYRTPLAEAEHPGIPILVKSDGRATVHERSSRRFQADVKKTGFFWHIAPEGDAFEAEFLEEAIELFEEVLRGAEDRGRADRFEESVGGQVGADAIVGH